MKYTLGQFLNDLFEYAHTQGIDYCFARRYDDLPNDKQSGDIDLLVSSGGAVKMMQWIRQTKGLTIVNHMSQNHVDSVFIAGIHWGDGYQAIQLDIFSQLTWKGVPYLPIENVLLRAQAQPDERKLFKIPDLVDEMVMTFFSTTVNAGVVKEQYWARWQKLAQKKPQTLRDKFKRRFGDFYGNALIDHIERDDQQGVIKNTWRWRFGFLQHNWHHEGMQIIVWMFKDMMQKIKTTMRLKKTSRIVFFGVDGAGKTTIIHELKKRLTHSSKGVHVYHVRPRLLSQKSDDPHAVLLNPHAKPNRNTFLSIVKLFYFFMIYWLDFFKIRRQPTIEIYDRYFHDMLVDPKRYRFGASDKILERLLRFIPRVDLAVCVDVNADTAHARKKELSTVEVTRQVDAYRDMVPQYFKNYLIVKNEQQVNETIDAVYTHCIKILGQKNRD